MQTESGEISCSSFRDEVNVKNPRTQRPGLCVLGFFKKYSRERYRWSCACGRFLIEISSFFYRGKTFFEEESVRLAMS